VSFSLVAEEVEDNRMPRTGNIKTRLERLEAAAARSCSGTACTLCGWYDGMPIVISSIPPPRVARIEVPVEPEPGYGFCASCGHQWVTVISPPPRARIGERNGC